MRGRLVVVVSRLETIMGLLSVDGSRRGGGGWTAARRTLTHTVYVCVLRGSRGGREGGREGGRVARLSLLLL